MTFFTPWALQSRVGRRVLLLFVVTALVPLAVMAVLSLSQVRSLLQEQASARLANNAKTYATGVYDRLLTARDVASLLSANASSVAVSSLSNSRGFTFLAKVDAGGRAKVLSGSMSDEASRILEEHRARPAKARTMLLPAGEGELYLLHRATDAPGADADRPRPWRGRWR